jgi:hypothetical protein
VVFVVFPIRSGISFPTFLSKSTKIKIHRFIILAFVLYGCETWSVTLRENHMFGVFENGVLRKIFVYKREEITGMEETAQ